MGTIKASLPVCVLPLELFSVFKALIRFIQEALEIEKGKVWIVTHIISY